MKNKKSTFSFTNLGLLYDSDLYTVVTQVMSLYSLQLYEI